MNNIFVYTNTTKSEITISTQEGATKTLNPGEFVTGPSVYYDRFMDFGFTKRPANDVDIKKTEINTNAVGEVAIETPAKEKYAYREPIKVEEKPIINEVVEDKKILEDTVNNSELKKEDDDDEEDKDAKKNKKSSRK